MKRWAQTMFRAVSNVDRVSTVNFQPISMLMQQCRQGLYGIAPWKTGTVRGTARLKRFDKTIPPRRVHEPRECTNPERMWGVQASPEIAESMDAERKNRVFRACFFEVLACFAQKINLHNLRSKKRLLFECWMPELLGGVSGTGSIQVACILKKI